MKLNCDKSYVDLRQNLGGKIFKIWMEKYELQNTCDENWAKNLTFD